MYFRNPVDVLYLEAMKAAQQIYPAVEVTPCLRSDWLSITNSGSVHLKLESQQVTGSFKARGAANKVLSLSEKDLQQGIVTSSTGNHGLAVLHAFKALQECRQDHPLPQPQVFLPSTASAKKCSLLKAMGATLHFCGTDCIDAELQARATAEREGSTYISPYNDLQVAGGQGTIALELLSQLLPDQLQAVFVPVGGGGLISGIASVLRAAQPRVRVIGCQPAASNVMYQSVLAGQIVDAPSYDTLSDGTAGAVEAGSVTFRPCAAAVDEWVCVSEAEIATAMLDAQREQGLRIEGAAGVAIAGFRRLAKEYQGQGVVIIVCGGNVSQDAFVRAEELVKAQTISSGASV